MRVADPQPKSGAVVVIGSGQAGGRAAEALRLGAHTGSITIIGDEVHPPYERPSLSKEFLHEPDMAKIAWVRPHAWYADNNVMLLAQRRVTKIDRIARRVALDDGTAVEYDSVVISTGARPRPLDIEGADHPAVQYLRSIDDGLKLRKSIRSGGRVMVIGAGFIGLEVAAAVKQLGGEVTVLERADRPMGRAVPPRIGDFYSGLHLAKGVDLRFRVGVKRIVEAKGRAAVELANGELLPADAIIVGIGVTPNDEIAREAGLKTENGIVVDEFGRTNDPAIYAAGDVTSHFNPLLGQFMRLESWQNAQNQAIAVAKNILGEAKVYAEIPWFWSDQFGINLQIAGVPQPTDEVVQRGVLGEEPVAMFHMRDGKLAAIIGIDSPREVRFGKEIIALGGKIKTADLEDGTINLALVARALKQAAQVSRKPA
jgi:NADPH-dependent 2,4-dienoyl-CoA reductase/sulfur reductase-like enzyme